MSEKSKKKGKPQNTAKSSDFEDFEDESECSHQVNLYLVLKGDCPGPGECSFLILFNEQIYYEAKWENDQVIDSIYLPLNLKEEIDQDIIADTPLMLLVRGLSGKPSKDADPFLNPENRAGGNVDLYPLALGEKEVCVTVPLVLINTGLMSGCSVVVHAKYNGVIDKKIKDKVPLMITMISAHCLPIAKEGTVYISGIALDGIHDPLAVKYGMSLSTPSATKLVWGTACNASFAANTHYNVPNEDKFIPNDLLIKHSENTVYWNAMKRVLVDPTLLCTRLDNIFFFEMAGVPKTGKTEARCRYIAQVDARVLLQPGQYGVTICAKLLMYNSECFPESVGTILSLPPSSARGASARDTDVVTDDQGHDSYIVIRLDLVDSLVPKAKITSLFDLIGFSPPPGINVADEALKIISPPEEPPLDRRRISKEAGALSVHKELSNLTYRSTLQMNKSIKRTAANRLLTRVRALLREFSVTDCSQIEYQDTITSQHSATRRAVTSSFAPQLPKARPAPGLSGARCRAAGNTRISNHHTETNLKISPKHPRVLLSKVLRCLEQRQESEAYDYLMTALTVHSRNRYLLWTYGGTQFDKGSEASEIASAAFRIAVKGDSSDGTTSAIGWAALHALHHYHGNEYAAFVAAKKMRKSYELPRQWRKCLKRWVDTSGEEESFWIPGILDPQNPFLITAAFFLCLRCFKLSERILRCVEEGCYERGTTKTKQGAQTGSYYVRAASLVLRRHLDLALDVAEKGIKRFGPCAMLCQMRATCLAFARGWDGECEKALLEADHAGAEPCAALLLCAALGGLKIDIRTSLQRAARAHKIAPSAFSALVIGRVYAKLGEEQLAERWAAAAVKYEPLFADGWAFLAILAMYKRDVNTARAMLRTAKEAGPLSANITADLEKVMKVVNVEKLPEAMTKDLCFCNYY
ncbi:uncharacterized protein [Battus philenor]|uniref:uncharacterized protein n=1 Tax=Battus philenor TaxID=42288 RepID=UPI0035D0C975